MDIERAAAARERARLNVAIRSDQKAAIDHLAEVEDLTPAQVARRLLDLGLKGWSDLDRPSVEELAGVAS
jgi:hypothetical protein